MKDTKIVNVNPGPGSNNSFWKIIILSIVIFIVIGLIVKNKKETAPAPGSNTETRSTDGIPPDSLHH